jgi:hypothetical protein
MAASASRDHAANQTHTSPRLAASSPPPPAPDAFFLHRLCIREYRVCAPRREPDGHPPPCLSAPAAATCCLLSALDVHRGVQSVSHTLIPGTTGSLVVDRSFFDQRPAFVPLFASVHIASGSKNTSFFSRTTAVAPLDPEPYLSAAFPSILSVSVWRRGTCPVRDDLANEGGNADGAWQ